MPWNPPPEQTARRRRRLGDWLTFGIVAALAALLGYLTYVAVEGSRQLTQAPRSADCRTPAAFGWSYEAINYDLATDAALAAEADPKHCATAPAPAGETLQASDGVRIAGWYVPAASGIGPEGPTVVLTHGYSANKSAMLERMAMLHETYNLVAFDFRSHGQSSGTVTTQGNLEQRDLRAVLDWLETNKAPHEIAVLGVSIGGATAVNVAARDERVAAVVIESTHATLANAIGARLKAAGHWLELPGSWAILLGGLVRTGQDMSAADPAQAVARLGDRPLLIIEAGNDRSVPPDDGETLLRKAADAGVQASLETCEPAGHAESPTACEAAYAAWVLGFLAQALGT